MNTSFLLSRLAAGFLAGVSASVFTGMAQTAAAVNPPRFTEVIPAANGELQLKVTGSTTEFTRIEVSTDLIQWQALTTLTTSGAVLSFTDSSTPRLPYRYYRASHLPRTGIIAGDHLPTSSGDLVIRPLNHATLMMTWSNQVIYADPTGGATLFRDLPRPTLVVITHQHGDHLDSPTLNAVGATNATIIAPSVVLPMLSAQLRAKTIVLANGRSTNVAGVTVEAIGMYNITAGRNNHTKGVGNGYVLTLGDRRVYISGDTEDVPEMRALEGIDVAFVCMNLPFTMDVNQAASAVREFRPRMVYPYHYRGSDVTRFKQLVGPDAGVEVRLRNWY